MANPNPDTSGLIPAKPGEARNPKGSSRKARLRAAMRRYIDEHGLETDVIEAWLGAALGDEAILKGRKPQASFMQMLLDRLDGKVTSESDEHDGSTVLKVKLGGKRNRDRSGGDDSAPGGVLE